MTPVWMLLVPHEVMSRRVLLDFHRQAPDGILVLRQDLGNAPQLADQVYFLMSMKSLNAGLGHAALPGALGL